MTEKETLQEIASYCGVVAKGNKLNSGDNERASSCYLGDFSQLHLNLPSRGKKRVSFTIYSAAKLNKGEPAIGPWLKSILSNSDLSGEFSTNDNRVNVDEGNVATFMLDINWAEWNNLSSQQKDRVKNLYGRLAVFLERNWPRGNAQEVSDAIATWNANNMDVVNDYLQQRQVQIKQTKNETTFKNSSNDLREPFKSWLVQTIKSHNEEKAKDYVGYIGKLFTKVIKLTGQEPAVGVFNVSSVKQFESLYKPAIEWAKDNDSNHRLYWNTSIKYYKDFLKEQEESGGIAATNNAQTPPGDEENKDIHYVELKNENGSIPRNLIYFGAPGTGKSFKLNEAVIAKRGADGRPIAEGQEGVSLDYERVTFYPTYSYAQFVGCYKPVMVPVADKNSTNVTGNEEIAYKFVPGPFLRILVKALNDPAHNYCLVIEEINRANAAAVFGDVFQLLDRNADGVSEYEITTSEDVKKFLESDEEKGGLKEAALHDLKRVSEGGLDTYQLKIPKNMYIWATMNSADQGVFPLDTAFKRRWEFEYIDINNGEDKSSDGKAKPEEWTIEG